MLAKLKLAQRTVEEILRLLKEDTFGFDPEEKHKADALVQNFRNYESGAAWALYPLQYASGKFETVAWLLDTLFENRSSYHGGITQIKQDAICGCIIVSGSISSAIRQLERGEKLVA